MNDEKATTTTTTGFGARGQTPPPTLKMFVGIEEKPSSSNVLESLLPPGPHGFSDLPTVLLLYGKNSL
jgi:hypothetical protein